MPLHGRIGALAATVTVSLMFLALVALQPALVALAKAGTLLAGAASVLVSAGLYSLVLKLLLWLFARWQLLRKWVLGRAFLEGTWVGHYVTDGLDRFTIEEFSQQTGSTVIVGREFDSVGKTRARWTSDVVSIDDVKMQLTYAYSCDVFQNKHVQQGLGAFTIIREKSKWPDKLDGYAVDLIDGDRDPNTEIKVSDSNVSDEYALKKAREYFCSPPA